MLLRDRGEWPDNITTLEQLIVWGASLLEAHTNPKDLDLFNLGPCPEISSQVIRDAAGDLRFSACIAIPCETSLADFPTIPIWELVGRLNNSEGAPGDLFHTSIVVGSGSPEAGDPPPALWSPALISTALWLDADDQSTITTVSGAVSNWDDKSGNFRNFVMNTAVTRPLYAAPATGQRGRVQFDGASSNGDLMLGPSAFTVTDSDLFVVLRHYNNSSMRGLLHFGGHCVYAAHTSPFQWGVSYTTTRYRASGQLPTNSTELIAVRGTNSGTLWLNGSQVGTHSGQYDNGNQSRIGVEYSLPGTTRFNGDIYEILLVPQQSAQGFQTIEGYLAHKHGINSKLSTAHPYRFDAPTA